MIVVVVAVVVVVVVVVVLIVVRRSSSRSRRRSRSHRIHIFSTDVSNDILKYIMLYLGKHYW